ncbi:MAG: hypothetical protein NVSMB45_11760 [Ginsengibacter sp.]
MLYLLNEKDDPIFYSTGNTFGKIRIAIKCFCKRLFQAITNRADIVFIHREAFITGSTLFERLFKMRSRIIYDFDDSIWIKTVSPGNKKFSFLKNGNKIKHLISMADTVVAGNEYLHNYASKFNKNVVIIPTTVDTTLFKPGLKQNKSTTCIGWSGSFTTLPHFETVIPALTQIKEKYGDLVNFKIISNGNYKNELLNIKETKWSLQTELKELDEIDIGIMPLPDDEWCRGKCGLKGLVFMSKSIPSVMSPVGVNELIIDNEKNGLLASTINDWIRALSMLIDSEDLRKKIGEKGRETVLNEYSVIANREKYLRIFQK